MPIKKGTTKANKKASSVGSKNINEYFFSESFIFALILPNILLCSKKSRAIFT